MRFTPDNKYFKLSLYTVFTLVLFYILKNIVDIAVLSLKNIDIIFKSLALFFGRAFSLFSLPLTAFVIAYLLDPVCDFFQNMYNKKFGKKNASRLQGTVISYAVIIFLFSAAVFFSGRYIGGLSVDFLISLCTDQLNAMYSNAVGFLIRHNLYNALSGYINIIRDDILNFFNNMGNSLIKGAAGFGSFLLNLLLGFVIAFYFLKDKEKYLSLSKKVFKRCLPRKIYKVLSTAAADCHSVFSGYIRGQLSDAFIMSLLISSFLVIFRIKFAVLIGIVSGFSNVIPYFGAITGFCLAVFSALLSGEPLKAVYAALIMLGLQQVDSVFIVPKIVGEKVELSPPAVIIALAVGGKLFGILGMIFAVPFCGIVKVIFKHRQSLRSSGTDL